MDIGTLAGEITLEDRMTEVLDKIDTALVAFGESATEQANKASASLKDIGKAVALASVPIAAFGAAALAAGYTVEGAFNTIARKTGETGESLAGLKKDFEAVFTKVPNSAEEVASALADVHQRLELTGKPLQDLTKQFLDYANVNQVDVAGATRTVIQMMGALSDDTNLAADEIGNASSMMDKLTFASQASGASVNQLAHGLTQGGKAMELLGFNFDQSLALFTQFEKVGANVTDVTSSMDRVLTNLAKDGVTDLSAAFKDMVVQIERADSEAKAIDLARELFGAKSGRKLAEEIRGGTYDIEAFALEISKLGNVTKDTADASQSFAEDMGTLRNQVTMALAPIGIEMIDAFKKLIPLVSEATGLLAKMLGWFADLPKPIQLTALAIGGVVVVMGPLLIALDAVIAKVAILGGSAGLAMINGLLFTLGNTIPVLTVRIWLMESALVAAGVTLGAIALSIAAVSAVLTIGYQAWMLYHEAAERRAADDRQAIIDQSNLQRVMQATGKEFKSMEEAADWLRKNKHGEDLRATAGAATEAAESFDMLKNKMLKMRSEAMEPLSAETKRNIAELDALGFSVDEIAKGMKNVSEPAIKRYVEQLKESQKNIKQAREELQKFNEFVDEQNRSWSRLGADAFKATAQMTADADRMTKAIISNMTIRTDSEREHNDRVMQLTTENITFQLYMLDKLAYNQKLKIDEIDAATAESAAKQIDITTNKLKEMARLQDEIDSSDDAFEGLTDDVEAKWKSAISVIGDALGTMFEGINNSAAQIFKVLGDGLEFLVAKGKEVGEKIAAGFAMAASVLSTALGPGGGGAVGQSAIGALSGAAAGAGIGTMIAPGIGTAIGAGIGAATGALLGWIGSQKKAREEAEALSKTLTELRTRIDQTYGSAEQYTQATMRVGMALHFSADMTKKQLEEFMKQNDEFERRMAAVEGAAGKMLIGFQATVSVMTQGFGDVANAVEEARLNIEELKSSGEATNEELALAAKDLAQALEAQNVAAERNKQALADLGTQALATFSAVFIATGSYSEAVAAVAPSIATLQQAYIDLGLEVENVALANLMIQSAVIESNPQLMAAIEGQAGAMQGMAQMGLLNAESFAAMQRTGTELYLRLQSETANTAAASGDLGDQTRNALLPMQGYLQQAARQAELLGLPLDDNTQRLIDQSVELGIWQDAGATAQDKLIEGMQGIVDKLDELLSRLGGMTTMLTNMPDANATVTIDHVDRYQSVFLPDVFTDESTIYAAGGIGFVPHGSDTVPAMLTPGERVLSTSENERYERGQNDMTRVERILRQGFETLSNEYRSMPDMMRISLENARTR